MSEDRLIPWLRNQVLVSRASGPVIRFDLMHIGPSGKYGNEVISVEGIPEKPDEDWFGSLASQLVASAQADAGALGGVQTYAVVCYRAKDPKRITGRFPYRVDGGSDFEEPDSFSTEPATKQGLVSQLMRHSEAQQKTMVAAIHTIMATTQRTLARLADQNEKLQEQRLEQIQVVEDLLSQRLQRELETEREKRRGELMGEAVKELKLLGPAVVNRLAGREVIPLQNDPKQTALTRLFESLSDDQKASLLKLLSADQQIALAELIRAIQPQQEN